MNKVKIIVSLIIVLFLANIAIYYINQTNINDKTELILEDNLHKLEIHYKSLLRHEHQIANSFYELIIYKKGFLDLYEKINNKSTLDKKDLRRKLQIMLDKEYHIMKQSGVLQFQFLLPNNISFLRMHQPDKFGDDLSGIRQDIKYTNAKKTISRGFVHGRVVHGFRNVYPIFSKSGKHLGALDISFASENFQNDLTQISGIHAHFLVNKEIFKTVDTHKNSFKNNYTQSSENKNFMMSLTKDHNKQVCIIDNTKKLAHLKDDILKNMTKGENFSFYTRTTDLLAVEVIAFVPVKGFNNKRTEAWLVSYTKNKFIDQILRTGQLINIFSFFILLLFAFFIYQQLIAEDRIKKEHTLFDDLINTSEDMIFMTNFKTIHFVNKKFKNYLSLQYASEIKDITSYFISMHGYLHNGLLKNNESFSQLILRTQKEDRIVCLLDSTMNPTAFTISIAKSSYIEGDYLVTLTDITKIRERELAISNKAFYDGLTGVYNRNKFDELIAIELKRDKRYKSNLSLAIVDIDHFKVFNDTYGHLIGDEVLIIIAKYLNDNVRDTDVFARWGGEEFVILFPETTSANARVVCEKLRLGIMDLSHPTAGRVTVSFGITQYKDGDLLDSLFKRCDDALYFAKENGRNQVSIK